MNDLILLAGAGLIGGLCNAIAGGGTFFTLPALIATGLPPIIANATSAMAIWPGHAASLLGSQAELRCQARRLHRSAPVYALGGMLGAVLLVYSDPRLFRALIPWLILLATGLFAFGPLLRRHLLRHRGPDHQSGWTGLVLDFLFAVYGSYFGAGLGVLLMAVLTMQGLDEPAQANAVKNALATIVTSIAVLLFALSGNIAWQAGLIVFAGAIAGGYLGGRLARWLKPAWLRAIVVAFGLFLAWHYA